MVEAKFADFSCAAFSSGGIASVKGSLKGSSKVGLELSVDLDGSRRGDEEGSDVLEHFELLKNFIFCFDYRLRATPFYSALSGPRR